METKMAGSVENVLAMIERFVICFGVHDNKLILREPFHIIFILVCIVSSFLVMGMLNSSSSVLTDYIYDLWIT